MISQTIGFASAIAVGDLGFSAFLQLGAHTFIAFLCSWMLKLSFPWRLFNLLLPLLISIFTSVLIPNSVLAILAVLILLVYIPTFWTRVPFYPTSTQMYDVVLSQIPDDRVLSFLDLGSGFSSMLFFLARERPNVNFLGVEIGPLPFLLSWLRVRISGLKNLQTSYKNFWQVDFSQFDMIYAFLAPGPMPALWEKCKKEMKPESVLFVNSFPVPAPHDMEFHVDDRRKTILYVYKNPSEAVYKNP
ncbi:MAG: hypothetical protein GYA55_01160 [SAR324 cluster bacterium]|uniref:Class I SAM-dependent methyltransferase n=1 Tax=SAR324 cluster bacterium TaxID=2024889 RepID=A0A7X9IKA2_9DELT|nr:hypothetical protein [SAR324 cluster bacterium]